MTKFDYDKHVQNFHPGHAMSRDALEHLEQLIDQLQPKTCVEFGPGLSSILLAQRIPSVICIDEPGPHHDKWTRIMADLHLSPMAVCVHLHDDGSYWVPDGILPVELVVIDGPWKAESRFTDKAFEGYRKAYSVRKTRCVVIDDYHRPKAKRLLSLPTGLRKVKTICDSQYPRRETAFIT